MVFIDYFMKKGIMWIAVLIAVAAIVIILLIARKPNQPIPVTNFTNYSNVNYSQINPANVNEVIGANKQFALDLFSLIKNKERGNIFYSPYSITSTLMMAFEGAEGKTAEEIKDVLHFPADVKNLREEYKNVYSDLNKAKEYKLQTANALWAQTDYPFSDAYISIIKDYYYGYAQNLNFITDPENSRITINKWVEDKTSGKIVNLIQSGSLGPETRLVLTNAIYFKANWTDQFDPDATLKQRFNLNSGSYILAKMMHKTSMYNYSEDNEVQVLELPYTGNELSMIIILPKNMSYLESNFDSTHFEAWKSSMSFNRVAVSLPRFKYETKYFISEELKKMGMPTAFDPKRADFGGMLSSQSNTEPLYISSVVHQTFIEVAEYGTEAAAATGITVSGSGPPDKKELKIFNADHPFIFLIQQKTTGNILFVGRLNEPTQA